MAEWLGDDVDDEHKLIHPGCWMWTHLTWAKASEFMAPNARVAFWDLDWFEISTCQCISCLTSIFFPPVSEAERNGLLGVGGDLHPDRLFKAYQNGIFPWYSEGQPILWFAPNPRFVIPMKCFRFSRSVKKNVKSNTFEIRINTAFEKVIEHCSAFPRPGQFGTWITEEMKQGYVQLHQQNYAHSFEAWQDGVLVGGLYGVLIEVCLLERVCLHTFPMPQRLLLFGLYGKWNNGVWS